MTRSLHPYTSVALIGAVRLRIGRRGFASMVDFPACQVATVRVVGDLAQEVRVLQFLLPLLVAAGATNRPTCRGWRSIGNCLAQEGESFDLDCAIPTVDL